MADDAEFVRLVTDRINEILEAVEQLGKTHLLVGVPESSDHRSDDKNKPIGNAALAYIHNYGSERAHIPARPFMEPGIDRSKKEIFEYFSKAAKAALSGNANKANNFLEACGMVVSENIKKVITQGIPPPLKRDTVRGRRKQRKTKSIRLAELKYEQLYRLMMIDGVSPEVAELGLFESKFTQVKGGPFQGQDFELDEKGARLVTPLINTGQLLNSITYVLEHDD